uniref:Uncharacterized protein n=1 Tax=Setaria italica TaxID=4555 RepID=K3Y1R6_SETIT
MFGNWPRTRTQRQTTPAQQLTTVGSLGLAARAKANNSNSSLITCMHISKQFVTVVRSNPCVQFCSCFSNVTFLPERFMRP